MVGSKPKVKSFEIDKRLVHGAWMKVQANGGAPGVDAVSIDGFRKAERDNLLDFRHTFATMNLSVGEHYMQVSKWLGHSSFVLTLSTYADYINEDELSAPEVGRGVVAADNVVEPCTPCAEGRTCLL